MVPGFGGQLVSPSYVEQHIVPTHLASTQGSGVARELARWWRRVTRSLGPASSTRAVFDVAVGPLLSLLGHRLPALTPFGAGLSGRLPASDADATLVVLPWANGVDEQWTEVVRAGLVADVRWAMVANGQALRIVDCRRTWTRWSTEFSLAEIVDDPRGVAALWGLASGNALPALSANVEASELQTTSVCRSLGDGVLSALPELTDALGRTRRVSRSSSLRSRDAYEQALTVVYRVLFLLFAEARGLVPVWHEVYREGYTIDALCRRIEAQPAAPGLWEAFLAISRMAHAGCHAGDLDVTAFNGRLFSPAAASLEHRHVPDAVIGRLILTLATTATKTGRRRIAYHDLGVEQLGAVYERVLEYQPSGAAQTVVRTSAVRKASGSFYTPRSLTEFVVRRTLHPLVDGKSADDILALRVLDPAMGSGAFVVAACRFLASQCERAMIRDGQVAGDALTPHERAMLRRQVAERCVFGVDRDPRAVQLARLSLWLTTLAADRPLTFLDHHLVVGNSLVGASLGNLAWVPALGAERRYRGLSSRSATLFDDELPELLASRVLPERLRLALEPSDTPGNVRQKERRLAALVAPDGPFAKWSRAADIWCGLSLWDHRPPTPGAGMDALAAALGAKSMLPSNQVTTLMDHAQQLSRDHSAFHWELAFPEVFFAEDGRRRADAGFDAVVANPPWDMLRVDDRSSATRATDRGRADAELRFFRRSGIYSFQGGGHHNRYQLFLERTLQLARLGGRVGLILPSGLATDRGSAPLRRRLLDHCTVDTWLSFDNRQSIFPIHRGLKFVVVSATCQGRTERLVARCGLRDVSVLDRSPSAAGEAHDADAVSISRARLAAWDPEHLSLPEVSGPAALAILDRAITVAPKLSAPDGWAAQFSRELNASDDAEHFVSRQHNPRGLPIVEGKHIAPFRVLLGDTTSAIARRAAARLISPAASFERDRIAYRDVASATNRVTLIAAMLPKGTISTHTLFCLKTPMTAAEQWCLLALLNSLPVNFLVRLSVSTHVSAALMSRLPVPRPAADSPAFNALVDLSQTLAITGVDASVAAFARLNAIVATLYQLTVDEYAHVVESFPLLPTELRAACHDSYSHDARAAGANHREPRRTGARISI